MTHQLIKRDKEWFCEVCQWTWRGKPRAACPGVIRYKQQPKHLHDLRQLTHQNLKPRNGAAGCIEAANKSWIWLYDPEDVEQLYPYPIFSNSFNDRDVLKTAEELKAMNHSAENAPVRMMFWNLGLGQWQFLYHIEDCPIADHSLPTIYQWDDRPPHLETPHNLQKFNLAPGDAPARGCVWNDRKKEWTYLYDPSDKGFEILDPSLPPCYRREAIPPFLKTKEQLKLLNLELNENATPCGSCGCYRIWEKYSSYKWELLTINLYDVKNCSIADPELPPCFEPDDYPTELKTIQELEEMHLGPGDAQPSACLRRYIYSMIETTLLYDPEDCVWQAKDHFICKTTLRRTYLLSDSWIHRLGDPDRITENPHHQKWSSMKLYSRQRVEAFLAENAEEYCTWLSERDRYIAIFEQNREAIEAGRQRARESRRLQRTMEIQQQLDEAMEQERQLTQLRRESDDRWRSTNAKREQMVRCLQCSSGFATQQGFCCSIHPLGLEDYQIPCKDWQER